MKIRIDKAEPIDRSIFERIWEGFNDDKSIIFQFVDSKDKADFLVDKTELWAKIGAVAGGLVGAVAGVVTLIHTGDYLAAFGAYQACVTLGATLGYGIGLILGLILWKWGAESRREPVFNWFGLQPNCVKVIPA